VTSGQVIAILEIAVTDSAAKTIRIIETPGDAVERGPPTYGRRPLNPSGFG